MNAYEIIRKKRNRLELTADEIQFLIRGYTDGHIPDYQMSAWLMAVYFNGMTFRETSDLTLAMRDSGDLVDLSDVTGVKVDKHSTGGVGDKISLILAPLAASIGLVVPMISGRGLGHTGGTLDKLESVSGFDINRPVAEFKKILKSIGVSMIGQTAQIAPADKKLYALRDVTATVESIPLISASIMSKKLAEGIDALVLDVKVGNGAFMRELEQAIELARHLIAIGESAGKSVIAVLTNMDEPLGHAVGNWLEMNESIETLKGRGPADIKELSLVLTSYMAILAEPKLTYAEAYSKSSEALSSGKAFEKFKQLIGAHGGDLRVIENPESYPAAQNQLQICASEEGFVLRIETFELGMAGVLLGAGRQRKEDTIDYSAGLIVHKKVGDRVKRDEPLVTVHYGRTDNLSIVQKKISAAYSIGHNAPDKKPLILGIMDRHGFRNAES